MSYTPTNWQSGDIVTSEKLNKLENGVAGAGGVLMVNASYDDQTAKFICDKVAAEMFTAISNGQSLIILSDEATVWSVISAFKTSSSYSFFVWNGDGAMEFVASDGSDYPSAGDD